MQSGGYRVGIIECQLDTAHRVLLMGVDNVPEVVGKRKSRPPPVALAVEL